MSKNKKHVKPLTEPAAPQLAPVAVLTITYLPPLNQIANIQPQFPAQMDAASVLHILRRAEETLISQLTLAQSKTASDANADPVSHEK